MHGGVVGLHRFPEPGALLRAGPLVEPVEGRGVVRMRFKACQRTLILIKATHPTCTGYKAGAEEGGAHVMGGWKGIGLAPYTLKASFLSSWEKAFLALPMPKG